VTPPYRIRVAVAFVIALSSNAACVASSISFALAAMSADVMLHVFPVLTIAPSTAVVASSS
jgi:hypothetical protein